MLRLLVATVAIAFSDSIPGFFSGLAGGLLFGELAIHRKRIGLL